MFVSPSKSPIFRLTSDGIENTNFFRRNLIVPKFEG